MNVAGPLSARSSKVTGTWGQLSKCGAALWTRCLEPFSIKCYQPQVCFFCFCFFLNALWHRQRIILIDCLDEIWLLKRFYKVLIRRLFFVNDSKSRKNSICRHSPTCSCLRYRKRFRPNQRRGGVKQKRRAGGGAENAAVTSSLKREPERGSFARSVTLG